MTSDPHFMFEQKYKINNFSSKEYTFFSRKMCRKTWFHLHIKHILLRDDLFIMEHNLKTILFLTGSDCK